MPLLNYIKKILNAKVYTAAIETPIDFLPSLSRLLKNNIYIKREDLQPIFSFKIRGALNKIANLTDVQKKGGIIAASAGNHAQGVALGAKDSGIQAVIVMPVTTPTIKVESVRERGAEVILHGDCFDEACSYAKILAEKHGYFFIHPYDDQDVIAGQGTIAVEILRQHKNPLDAIFVPVGGGGLIAGIAVYVKYLRPDIKIIGVEPEDAACLKSALSAGKRTILDKVGIFADGVAVAQIGKEPFEIAKEYVDEVITVSTDEICASIRDIFNGTRSIAEPAGALALAGLQKFIKEKKVQNKHLMAIESGANINFKRLRYVSQRTDLGDKKEVLLAVTIPECPGSLKQFYRTINGHDITEFNYRFNSAKRAHFLVAVNISSESEYLANTIKQLTNDGYDILDFSNNELAKEHICHMSGGAVPNIQNERIFRFEFPERIGALLQFLNAMPNSWNISLFQYRKQGGSYAQVCIGLQIPTDDKVSFAEFAKELNYRYTEETDNPAYRLFLR